MGKVNCRHICFTINNPITYDIQWNNKVRYAIWQLEKGENGTNHLQGYVEFDKPLSFKAIKDILGNTAHLESRKGSREQAREYCQKNDTKIEGPWEYGTWISGPGHRTDIDLIIECLKEGMNEREICDIHPNEWARNYKVIDRWNLLNPKERSERTEFHVFWGESETGKSRLANELSPNAFWKSPGKWFDGYNGNEDLILDEADKQDIPIGLLLNLADRYKMRVPVKGGFKDFNAKRIFATSNFPLEQWYPSADGMEYKALKRRVDSVTRFTWEENGNIKTVKRQKEVYMLDWEARYNPEELLVPSPLSSSSSALQNEGGFDADVDGSPFLYTAKDHSVPLSPPISQSEEGTGNEVRGNTTPAPRSPSVGTKRKSAVRSRSTRKKTK